MANLLVVNWLDFKHFRQFFLVCTNFRAIIWNYKIKSANNVEVGWLSKILPHLHLRMFKIVIVTNYRSMHQCTEEILKGNGFRSLTNFNHRHVGTNQDYQKHGGARI